MHTDFNEAIKDIRDQVKGILIDLDGTVYIHGKPLDGVQEILDRLMENYNVLFLTNTDSKSKSFLMDYFLRIGLHLPEEKVFSVPEYIHEFLMNSGKSTYLLVTEDLEEYFQDVKQDDFSPDCVIVGDVRGRKDLQERLNTALRCLKRGADLYVMQKGITYVSSKGLSLDSGSYGKLLENASGKKMKVLGKPNPDFIISGCKKIGIEPTEACMVGDDLEADIEGGKKVGAKTILVKTGKYDEELLEEYMKNNITPDVIINSFLEIEKVFPLDQK